MKPAVMFDMFGPYHLARLNALGARYPTLGIEIAARSGTYDWRRIEVKAQFERRTLFDVNDSSEVSAAQIHRATHALSSTVSVRTLFWCRVGRAGARSQCCAGA